MTSCVQCVINKKRASPCVSELVYPDSRIQDHQRAVHNSLRREASACLHGTSAKPLRGANRHILQSSVGTAAVAGDSDGSDVVTGVTSYVSSSSLLLLLYAVIDTVPPCEHPWSGSLAPGTACDYKLRCRISIHTSFDSFVIKRIPLFLSTTNLEAVPNGRDVV